MVFSQFATSFGGPSWPDNRMQVFGIPAVGPFFEAGSSVHLFAHSVVYTQCCKQQEKYLIIFNQIKLSLNCAKPPESASSF